MLSSWHAMAGHCMHGLWYGPISICTLCYVQSNYECTCLFFHNLLDPFRFSICSMLQIADVLSWYWTVPIFADRKVPEQYLITCLPLHVLANSNCKFLWHFSTRHVVYRTKYWHAHWAERGRDEPGGRRLHHDSS